MVKASCEFQGAFLAALLVSVSAMASDAPPATDPTNFYGGPQDVGLSADTPGRWSAEKARAWYAKQPWLVGVNYVPSTAVNDVEMWQAATFDPLTIKRE